MLNWVVNLCVIVFQVEMHCVVAFQVYEIVFKFSKCPYKLYTINFSATQEIDRIQQQEITKVQSIQTDLSNANTTIQQQATKITTLETQIADILTRLSNLENTGSS